jgi:uncharacterized protein
MQNRIFVRDIRPADIADIVSINHGASPGVSTLDLATAERLIAAASVAWAAVEDDRIVGYLIAMLADARYDGDEFLWFKQRGDDFVYVDQIAMAPLYRGRGVGGVLYDSLEHWAAGNKCRTVTCEVNLAPPNTGSLAFHASCGFVEVGRMTTSDTRHVALLEHDLCQASDAIHRRDSTE